MLEPDLNLITTWSRVLLERLTGFELVRKFPTFNVMCSFITAFTRPGYQTLF